MFKKKPPPSNHIRLRFYMYFYFCFYTFYFTEHRHVGRRRTDCSRTKGNIIVVFLTQCHLTGFYIKNEQCKVFFLFQNNNRKAVYTPIPCDEAQKFSISSLCTRMTSTFFQFRPVIYYRFNIILRFERKINFCFCPKSVF